jgi:hypothetical protein
MTETETASSGWRRQSEERVETELRPMTGARLLSDISVTDGFDMKLAGPNLFNYLGFSQIHRINLCHLVLRAETAQ